MGTRRQANVDSVTLQVYADDLEGYDERDIASVCDKIGRTRRQEGELAFPDLGTVTDAVRTAQTLRCPPRNQYLEEMEEYRRQARENPDQFVNLREDQDFAAVLVRHGIGVEQMLTDRKEPK